MYMCINDLGNALSTIVIDDQLSCLIPGRFTDSRVSACAEFARVETLRYT